MEKKRTLAFVATLGALLLTACAGNNPATSSTQPSRTEEPSVTSTSTPAPSSTSQRQGEVISYFEMKLPNKIKFTVQDLLSPHEDDYCIKIGEEYLSYHDGYCNYFKKLSENSYSHYYKFTDDEDWSHEPDRTFDRFASLWTIGLYQYKRDDGYVKDNSFKKTISGKTYTGNNYYDKNNNCFAYLDTEEMKFVLEYADDSGLLGVKVSGIDTTVTEFPIPVPSSK